jgi:hypothetical protein
LYAYIHTYPGRWELKSGEVANTMQARAKAASGAPKGKLGSQLQEQKKQRRVDTLGAASKDERLARDADAAAETRAYN